MRKKIKDMQHIIQIAYKLDATVIWIIVIGSIIHAISLYVPIIVIAQVIESITRGEKYEATIRIAIIGSLVLGGLTIIDRLRFMYMESRIHIAGRRFQTEKARKTILMDYQQIDESKTREILERIATDSNWGNRFLSVYWDINSVVTMLSIVGVGSIILGPLVVLLNDMNYTRYIVIMMVFMAIPIAISLFKNMYTTKRQMDIFFSFSSSMKHLRAFLFHLNPIDYKIRREVRIYKGKALINGYLDKGTQIFMDKMPYLVKLGCLEGMLAGMGDAIVKGVAYLGVAILGMSGMIGISEVVKYAAVIYIIGTKLGVMTDSVGRLSDTTKRQQSMLEYLVIPPVLYKGSLPIEKRQDNEYEIEFRDVSFKYPGSERYVLNKFSITLKVGEKLAVVGMNGSGKTTMIKLLCRLYDPDEGEILLNGINIKKYDYEEYMSLFSIVFQDFKLFSLPIGQNIAGSLEYERDEVRIAARKAGIEEWLDGLQAREETVIYNEYDEVGMQISEGEAQKIALARALYKDAPFMILDEPTAALDPIAEFEIYKKFNEIVGDKTTIYISHRLSSCRFCDDIVVFHQGRIIQHGSHEILLKDIEGKYYELWHAQAQYYDDAI